jgi:hypothetical protein
MALIDRNGWSDFRQEGQQRVQSLPGRFPGGVSFQTFIQGDETVPFEDAPKNIFGHSKAAFLVTIEARFYRIS